MLEVCCGSFEDAMVAYEGGAKRIELNSALELGGLTPTLGSLMMTKQYTDLEVMTMVRLRGAGFCYTDYEYEQMVEDAKLLLAYGTDGLVFGFLKDDLQIDKVRTKEFVQLAHEEGRTAVFHRAFDCTSDAKDAIETLIEVGVDRVLTSGMAHTVDEGIDMLKELQTSYGNQIEILAGCGISVDNIDKIMNETGITQIHSSCKSMKEDKTTVGKEVSFAIGTDSNELSYGAVDAKKVKELIDRIK